MGVTMLNESMKQQLATYLQNLKQPVTIVKFVDDSAKSKELSQLVEQIGELSAKVRVEAGERDKERVPSMLIRSEQGTEIRFAGLPMGHEFTSLVLALLHSGGHPLKLDTDVIEQIRALDSDLHFETFVSLSCQNCPDVVQALNMMAALNPRITHVMIDGAVYPEEAEQRNVLAVPSVFLNGESFSQGRITLSEILGKVDNNAAKRVAATLNDKKPYDFLVVGGGPAGASAAIYAARKGIRTGIVADRFGGQVADTLGIENFIATQSTTGPKLVASLEEHVKDYDVDIMKGQKASQVIPAQNAGDYIKVELENGAVLKSRSILLATGARWREMNVPGEKEYRGSGVAYCPHCDGPLFKGKRVAVIGGGNSGIEAALDLAGIVEHVTVLEFDSRLRADEVLQRKVRDAANIDVITQAQTTEVVGDGNKVTALTYKDRASGEQKSVALAGIFVQIGLIPNAEFLRDTIELTERGEIIVGAKGETSQPGIYAAGDVTNIPFKQIIIAMGQGANAALGAFDYLMRAEVAVASHAE
jgi:alkyl hydroperoxide reductase subunit F